MQSNPPNGQQSQQPRRRIALIVIPLLIIIVIAGVLITWVVVHRGAGKTSVATPTLSPQLGVYVGAGDGSLYKLDGAGAFHWRFKTQGKTIPAPPAVANGVVYVGSTDGNVYALNAENGMQLWQFTTGATVVASPTVANGVVYIGSSDGSLYAVDAQNGTKLWSYSAGTGNGGQITVGTASVDQGEVFASASDGVSQSFLFALNTSDGSQVWRTDVANQILTNPQVVNGVIYVAASSIPKEGTSGGTSSFVYAYNATDGSQIWQSSMLSSMITADPTVVDGTIYFGSQDGNVYSLSADSGTELWHRSVGEKVAASPRVIDGVVYVGVTGTTSTNNLIVALNVNDGSLRWQHPLPDYAGANLAVSNGIIYVGASDSIVYALSTTAGSQLWSHQDTAPFSNTPITVA